MIEKNPLSFPKAIAPLVDTMLKIILDRLEKVASSTRQIVAMKKNIAKLKIKKSAYESQIGEIESEFTNKMKSFPKINAEQDLGLELVHKVMETHIKEKTQGKDAKVTTIRNSIFQINEQIKIEKEENRENLILMEQNKNILIGKGLIELLKALELKGEATVITEINKCLKDVEKLLMLLKEPNLPLSISEGGEQELVLGFPRDEKEAEHDFGLKNSSRLNGYPLLLFIGALNERRRELVSCLQEKYRNAIIQHIEILYRTSEGIAGEVGEYEFQNKALELLTERICKALDHAEGNKYLMPNADLSAEVTSISTLESEIRKNTRYSYGAGFCTMVCFSVFLASAFVLKDGRGDLSSSEVFGLLSCVTVSPTFCFLCCLGSCCGVCDNNKGLNNQIDRIDREIDKYGLDQQKLPKLVSKVRSFINVDCTGQKVHCRLASEEAIDDTTPLIGASNVGVRNSFFSNSTVTSSETTARDDGPLEEVRLSISA